ncbi:glycosyltransferase family 4 protein [Candidatus Bathyarchaeota archaeon]|nr:glycosyltransferase family 4 protein [Candidatus Bathyarchaeota archaeon]
MVEGMRICFVASEIFAFGQHGGFGKLTRDIAEGLAEKGIEVFVLIHTLSTEQRNLEVLDKGITVIKLPRVLSRLASIFPLNKTKLLYKLPDADVYHSESVLIDSWLCMRHNPNRKHIITFQDPRSFSERWRVKSRELNNPNWLSKADFRFRRYVFEFFEKLAVRNADKLYCQARFIIPKVMEMYDLPEDKRPEFLPNPVRIPKGKIKKADEPTVCFLGRWDAQKRPELFLSLAKEFPHVKFIAMGKAHNETVDKALRNKYRKFKNLEMPGFVSEEEKSEILAKSWAMINTSIRECLPVAFLESLAHETPIISGEDPDNLVSKFGVKMGYRFEDYVCGLRKLLRSDWRSMGKSGRRYVEENHEYWKVIDRHIEVYKRVLEEGWNRHARENPSVY